MLLFLFYILICLVATEADLDDLSCPKFYYEEKILSKVVRLEHQLDLKGKVIQTLEEKFNTQEQQLSEQEKRMGAMEVQKQKIIDTDVPSVAFLAKTASNRDLCDRQVVVYTNSLLNVGDGYDATTGFFTAPVSGIYMFKSQVCSTKAQYANLHLYANGTVIAAISFIGADDYGTCSSFGGIAVLHKGEKAAIKGSYSCRSVFTDNFYRYNTFCGTLINTPPDEIKQNGVKVEHKG